ncbi:hypothetical protein HGRIS_011051 [Hohenbuehelia grisea]|uniref:Uncharacterized protein n=1 Tax=Hohenbuehelia grisea TaxID=104357 RepID=A0ABR3IZ33_9AGAR
MATATMTATAPPPTHNALQPAQRIRLMRSTRKLGAILGATPHLIDPYESSYPISRSQSTSSVSSISSNDSSAPKRGLLADADKSRSSKKSSKTRAGSHPSPSHTLFLKLDLHSPNHARLESIEIEPKATSSPIKMLTSSPIRKISSSSDLKKSSRSNSGDHGYGLTRKKTRLRRSSSANAYWDLASNSSQPSGASVTRSASTSIDSAEARLRRKRMAKLQRTLGENVPVELVFKSSPLSASPAPSDPFSDPEEAQTPQLGSTVDFIVASPESQNLELTSSLASNTPRTSPAPSSRKSAKSNDATPPSSSSGRPRPLSLSSIPSPTMQFFGIPKSPREGPSNSSEYGKGQSFLLLSPCSPALPSPRFSSPPGTLLRSPGAGPEGVKGHTQAVSLDWGTRPFIPTEANCLLEAPAFGRRKEKEWSGEWNKEDMAEVVKRLRGLKTR